MKRFIGIGLLIAMLALVSPQAVLAAPNENASRVGSCAVQMGGQHVANCAQTMDQGVSSCAQMSGPCTH